MDPVQQPAPTDPNQISFGNAKLSRSFVAGWSFFLALLFGFIAVIFSMNAFTLIVHGKKAQGTITAVRVDEGAGKASDWNADVSYTGKDCNA